jgi:hypothetical protein
MRALAAVARGGPAGLSLATWVHIGHPFQIVILHN